MDSLLSAISLAQCHSEMLRELQAILEAAESFARYEGFIVAPETAHAVQAVYDEAMACKESGESKVILFNCSGHGHFDLAAYDAFHRQDLPDYELEQKKIDQALVELPQVE